MIGLLHKNSCYIPFLQYTRGRSIRLLRVLGLSCSALGLAADVSGDSIKVSFQVEHPAVYMLVVRCMSSSNIRTLIVPLYSHSRPLRVQFQFNLIP